MNPTVEYKSKEARHELRLTVALRQVLERAGAAGDGVADHDKPLTLGLIVEVTGERAFGVLMAFLCLPFLTPIPLPGLSIVFGVALLLLGGQVAMRKHRPWLPARMMKLRLPPKFGPRLIGFVAKIFGPLEKIIRPRLLVMQNPAAMVLVGVALMFDGLLLSLPLPPVIPLSNALPAWMAMIKILGITEEDGAALAAGTVLTLGALGAAGVGLTLWLTRAGG
jgi:hypothetical protein